MALTSEVALGGGRGDYLIKVLKISIFILSMGGSGSGTAENQPGIFGTHSVGYTSQKMYI